MSLYYQAEFIETALKNDMPLVGLESAFITHGLPRPANLECAQKMEQAVEDAGAVAATMALVEGILHIGLETEQLVSLAQNTEIEKVGLHNMAPLIAAKKTAGTTVATTIWLAKKAGINIIATGGIGGVHRGDTADVSGDLPQLARSDAIVVCSGAKIILDLPATREWLETWGITVIGYQTDKFPGFYTSSTSLPVDATVSTPAEAAHIWKVRRETKQKGSMLLVQSPPQDLAVEEEEIEDWLDQCLQEADQEGISGGRLTPFLLARLAELSRGRTLEVNVALLESNARLAGQVACELV